MGEKRNVYRVLARKPEGKRPLRRSRSRWEENITLDLREIGWEGVDWMHMACDNNQWWALMNKVMNYQIP